MMKSIIIILLCLAVAFAITGCEEADLESDVVLGDDSIGGKRGTLRCTENSDCVIGGCSGTICQHKDSEPVMTTCEFKPEYACFKQIECGCIGKSCMWDKTSDFDSCVEEARGK